MSRVGGQVIVAGVGYSELGRATGRSEGSLAAEAIISAITDSGLGRESIDGLATFPDRVSGPFEGPSIAYMQQSLGLEHLNWFAGYGSGPAQFSSVIGAIYAIAAGAAHVVICYRAHLRQRGRYYAAGAEAGRVATYTSAFRSPYGAPGGAAVYGMWANRFLRDSGYTEEDLGAVVINARHNAQLNPRAAWYGHPVTLDDYLKSEYVATPLRILDCDYPVDGAVAVVLASADRVPDIRQRPVMIEATAHGAGPALEWELWPDMGSMISRYVGQRIWSCTDIRPRDVDVAEIYDGFSWFPLCWLEDLRLCERGAAGDFFRSGAGLVGGRLPVSTEGGQLGEGRLHGIGKLAEAALQLRGQCDARQVEGADIAIAAAGGGTIGSVILLTN